jgi:hypothetical protein
VRTRLDGTYAAFVHNLTTDLDKRWMSSLVTDIDECSGRVEVCGLELDRYLTRGSSVERSFAVLIAAAIYAAGHTTDVPEPSGAAVITALRRGGDSHREAALLAACLQLVAEG